MLNMSQINHIRDLARCGKKPAEIARETQLDPKTVRKYLKQEDFSPVPQETNKRESKLDPYKPRIDQWLEEDRQRWYKQRHTAQRIFDRLVHECSGFDCSYPTVVRYVRGKRIEMQARPSFQELVWHPGEAQVDFGEADFEERGALVRKKYLTVSFPYSNDSFTQVFGGETAECVCQGLQDIFGYIGGVPGLLVFDNATGVGRRIGERVQQTKLFAQFRAHYNFSVRFCNPNAGHEKGNVENKVGYTRRNLFVPPLAYDDLETFNKDLFKKHRLKAGQLHYKKQVPIRNLFEKDRQALQRLPAHPFNVCRYETILADSYGKVRVDDHHYYATRPEYGGQQVVVGLRAHTVEILTRDYQVLTAYDRQYGKQRTDNTDYATTLAILLKNVGAWPNSGIREQMSPTLREALDGQTRAQLRQSLRALQQICQLYDFGTALETLEDCVRQDQHHFAEKAVLTAHVHGYGLLEAPDKRPDLRIYDRLLEGE